MACRETPNGKGYTLVAAGGGVFTYGDAPFFDSLGSHPPASPIVDLSPAPADNPTTVGERTYSPGGGGGMKLGTVPVNGGGVAELVDGAGGTAPVRGGGVKGGEATGGVVTGGVVTAGTGRTALAAVVGAAGATWGTVAVDGGSVAEVDVGGRATVPAPAGRAT